MTIQLPRIATASVALTLLLAAAGCSSDDKDETGAQQTTTTAATSGDNGGDSGSTDSGGSSAASDELCTKVPAATVAEITGVQVTTAEPISAGERADMSSTGPSCSYNTTSGIGGITAEFIGQTKFSGFTAPDSFTPVEPLSGLGDAAFKGVSATDPTSVTRILVNDGDQYLFIQFFSGVPEAKAVALAEKMLG